LRQFKHQIVRLIFGGRDLLQDHIALTLKLFFFQNGGGEDVGQNVHGQGPVILQCAGIIGGGFHAGGRIDLAPCAFNLFGDGLSVAPLGAFEGHVFQKMRDAIFIGHFIAGTRLHPDALGHRLQMRHHLSDDGKPILKPRNLN